MDILLKADADNTKTLFTLLQEQNYILPSTCMKKGTCGDCAVQVTDGHITPSDNDLKYFSNTELLQGFRLACTACPKEPVQIQVPDSLMKKAPIKSTMELFSLKSGIWKADPLDKFLLIDLGTTTIVLLLADAEGTVLDSLMIPNNQEPYGADVISRLQYACGSGLATLSAIIRGQLKTAGKQILRKNNLLPMDITHCYLAGNTSMIHFLMKYPCETLGVAPFTPYDKSPVILKDTPIPVTIFPCISAFVGGDLAAGIYSLDFEKRKTTALLLDIGTNAEIALLHQEKCYVTSAAAGPAMEGGNLSCGGPSIPGAIYEVNLNGILPRVKTIKNKIPHHICGTGAISCVAELIRNGYIEPSGVPTKKFATRAIMLAKSVEGHSVAFTADDVREMQLALSSIRAGYGTLLSTCGIEPSDVDVVYLAGGFGCEVDISSAFTCRLFPPEWEGKIQAVGNSCLAGLYKYSVNRDTEFFEAVTAENSFIYSVPLADNKTYQTIFLKSLTFK